MTEYKVKWEIDLSAESPREAAETALSWLREAGSECVVFEVDGQVIDLMEYEDD